MTTHLARIVEAFNAGRLDEVVAQTTDDYHYSDPIGGRVDGASAHADHMRSILARFPDRKIEILRSWAAPGAQFGEYRWTGTPVEGGEPRELIFATVIELDGDRMRRWANLSTAAASAGSADVLDTALGGDRADGSPPMYSS